MTITIPVIDNKINIDDTTNALKMFGHQLYLLNKKDRLRTLISLRCKNCDTRILLDSIGYDVGKIRYWVFFSIGSTGINEKSPEAYCEKYRLLY